MFPLRDTIRTRSFPIVNWLIIPDNVEDRLGPVGYVLFYFMSGIVAALTQSFISAGSRLPLVGLFALGRPRVEYGLNPEG